jgi:hypothetical protein
MNSLTGLMTVTLSHGPVSIRWFYSALLQRLTVHVSHRFEIYMFAVTEKGWTVMVLEGPCASRYASGRHVLRLLRVPWASV